MRTNNIGMAVGAACLLCACGNSDLVTTKTGVRDAGDWQPMWAPVESAGLRPGSRIRQSFSLPNTVVPDTIPCTLGFLFVDPLKHLYYVGTAAHCTGTGPADEHAIGSRVMLSGVGEIGSVVFDSDAGQEQAIEARVDFSLIQLDQGINLIAHPQVIGSQAPMDFIGCEDTAAGDLFSLHGHGVPFGAVEPAQTRTGVLVACDGKDYVGYAAIGMGDSGGPVIHVATGAALGVVSRIATGAIPPATLTGPTLPYIRDELAKAGFTNLALATADGGYVFLRR